MTLLFILVMKQRKIRKMIGYELKENREFVSKLFKHLTLLALLINPSICLSQSESTETKK